MTINSIFNQGFTNPFSRIIQSSQNISDTSTNIADDNLYTLTRTDEGNSEYIEVDLSEGVNLEELQSVVVYTSNATYDPSFNKIKIETTNNVALDISEIQIWVDNSNIAPNSTVSHSSFPVYKLPISGNDTIQQNSTPYQVKADYSQYKNNYIYYTGYSGNDVNFHRLNTNIGINNSNSNARTYNKLVVSGETFDGSTKNLWFSDDGGLTWIGKSLPSSLGLKDNKIMNIAYGNGVYVAGGTFEGTNGNTLIYSTDYGNTWTGLGKSIIDNTVAGLVFEKNIFVAGGTNTGIYYSSDGINWTAATVSGVSNSGNYLLKYVNNIFIASQVNGNLVSSTDGKNWSQLISLKDINGTGTGFSFAIRDIAYGNGVYVAVGDGESIGVSSDLANWTFYPGLVSPNSAGTSVAYGNNTWVVVGRKESTTNHNLAYSTDDGNTWTSTSLTLLNSYEYEGLIYYNDKFVLFGYNVYNCIAFSTDGINWTQTSNNGLSNDDYPWGLRGTCLEPLIVNDPQLYFSYTITDTAAGPFSKIFTVDSNNNLYFLSSNSTNAFLYKYNPITYQVTNLYTQSINSGDSASDKYFMFVSDMVFDANDNLYISRLTSQSGYESQIVKWDTNSTFTVISTGSGGNSYNFTPGSALSSYNIRGKGYFSNIRFDSNGRLFIFDNVGSMVSSDPSYRVMYITDSTVSIVEKIVNLSNTSISAPKAGLAHYPGPNKTFEIDPTGNSFYFFGNNSSASTIYEEILARYDLTTDTITSFGTSSSSGGSWSYVTTGQNGPLDQVSWEVGMSWSIDNTGNLYFFERNDYRYLTVTGSDSNSINYMLNNSISGLSSKTNIGTGEYFQFDVSDTNYRNLQGIVIYDPSKNQQIDRKVSLLYNNSLVLEIPFHNRIDPDPNPEENASTELSHYWYFINTGLNNSDRINSVNASLVNFSASDSNINGIDFDGSSNYINLGTNTINVGGDNTIGNGFSFETYVKSGVVNLLIEILDPSGTWAQIGQDIDGKGYGDKAESVSLSSDGTIVAIGAPGHDAGNLYDDDRGSARVYQYNGTSWNQLGEDIYGLIGDQNGFSVSLSSDGTIIATGAPYNDITATNAGVARVYQYNGTSWSKLGQDIVGENGDDQFGRSLSLSSDGTIVAIGAHLNDGNGTDSGSVRIYQYNNNSWVQLGGDIDGEASDDKSGWTVAISSDGTIVAIGSRSNSNDSGSGHVRVYQYDATKTTAETNQSLSDFGPIGWRRLGADIDGTTSSGHCVSLSSDGKIVAISHHVTGTRVYQYDGSSWNQLGQVILDEETGDRSGWSINLSSDGTIIAIGAYLNDGNGNNSGHVRVYQYIDSTWTQVGQDIDGEEDGDLSGWTVSLSSDGSIVAIGARYNDGNMHDINVDYNKGHVRVYEIPKIQQQIKVTKHILALGDDDTNKLELTTSGNNTILSLTNSGTTYDVSSNSALSTTEFSHIVGLINDNTMSLYIDNTLAGSVAVTPFSLGTTFTKNYLGSDLSNNSLFKGTMAYFKTWLDYKLLTNEITDLYNNRTGVNNVYSKITKINGGATSENNSKIKKLKFNQLIILSYYQNYKFGQTIAILFLIM